MEAIVLRHRRPSPIIDEIREIIHEEAEIIDLEREILRELRHDHRTPTAFNFTGAIDMNPEGPNVTQVWTATPAPAGSAFPAGTTFTATPSDTTVSATLDATGLILTIAYPSTFVADPANPFNVVVASSTFVPSPASAPSQVSETVTPTAPPPATPTPTSFGFAQTT